MRLADLQHQLRSIIEEVMPHYDRVQLLFDTSRPVLDAEALSELKTLCTDATFHPVPEHKAFRRWKQQLTLLQPTLGCFQRLRHWLESKYYACRVSYVELAVDWITQTENDAKNLHDLMEAHIIFRTGQVDNYYHYYRHPTSKGLSTTYFAPRESDVGLVMYSDRQSKRVQRPCAHLEIRLSCSEACERRIATLNELIDFDILNFFRRKVKLYDKLTKKALGRWVSASEKSHITTDQGYIKACDRFLASHELNYETLKLQQLLVKVPESLPVIQPERYGNPFNEKLSTILFT